MSVTYDVPGLLSNVSVVSHPPATAGEAPTDAVGVELGCSLGGALGLGDGRGLAGAMLGEARAVGDVASVEHPATRSTAPKAEISVRMAKRYAPALRHDCGDGRPSRSRVGYGSQMRSPGRYRPATDGGRGAAHARTGVAERACSVGAD